MSLTEPKTTPSRWRALLILGRVSNLPTVWSNCLAGWLLGGAGPAIEFAMLCLGANLLYLGGMFLNDAFDVEFDQQYRRERPIPAGVISAESVLNWGLFWLGTGALFLILLGPLTAVLTVLLVVCIVLYDLVHKRIVWAPLLMAACRWLLYLIAASIAWRGVTGLVIWSGLALAIYIVGLSYLARGESAKAMPGYWPVWLLGAPILLALLVNTGLYRQTGLLLSTIVALWILICLHHTFWTRRPNVGCTVSGLLAGIVLVDLLAIAGGQPFHTVLLVSLFFAARLAQRLVPAT